MKNDAPEQKSHKLETLPHKEFRVLIVPSITGAVAVRPKEPDPEYLTRHTPPTVENIPAGSSDTSPTPFTTDKTWHGERSVCLVGARKPVWTSEIYSRIIQEKAELAYVDSLVNRSEILRRRVPQRGDLKFDRYSWGMKSPIRTAAGFKKGGLVPMQGAEITEGDEKTQIPTDDNYADVEIDVTREIIAATKRKGYSTPRDRELIEIMRWRQRGLTQAEISKRMELSPEQVQRRCGEIKRRMGTRRAVADTVTAELGSKNANRVQSESCASKSKNVRKSEEVNRNA